VPQKIGFRERGREVQRFIESILLGDRLEEILNGLNTDRPKHFLTVFFCVRNIARIVLHYDSSGTNP
jgi:hypothetical protein